MWKLRASLGVSCKASGMVAGHALLVGSPACERREGQLAVAGLSGPRPWLAAGGRAESVGAGIGPARPEGVLRWSLPGRLGRLVLVQRASEAARRCEYHGVARRLLRHEVEDDARGALSPLLRMSPQTMLAGLPACGRQWRQLAQVFTGCSPGWEIGVSRRGSGRKFRGGLSPLVISGFCPIIDCVLEMKEQVETAPNQVHRASVNILAHCKH